ncbi:hypothetical protein ACFQ0B_35675 [Nonomuraea thailandensis]
MLGPDLLVAPVLSADGEISYYVPRGVDPAARRGERHGARLAYRAARLRQPAAAGAAGRGDPDRRPRRPARLRLRRRSHPRRPPVRRRRHPHRHRPRARRRPGGRLRGVPPGRPAARPPDQRRAGPWNLRHAGAHAAAAPEIDHIEITLSVKE